MRKTNFIKICISKSSLYVFVLYFFTAGLVFAQSGNFNYFNKNTAFWENLEYQKAKKLKIKIRELRSAYYLKDEKLPKKKTLVEVSYFDKNGNMFKQEDINSVGYVRMRTELSYDDKENLIDVKLINQDELQIYRKEIFYNGKDTAEVFITDRKKNRTRQAFFYNDTNQITQKQYFDEKDSLYLTLNYSYQDGALHSIAYMNGKNDTLSNVKINYDLNGNLSSEITDGKEKKYILDEQGRLIRIEEGTEVTAYKYNTNGDVIDYQYYTAPNRRQFRLGFTYLKNGLVKEVIRYESDDRKAFYSVYTYKK